jgi:Methyltransferase domain
MFERRLEHLDTSLFERIDSQTTEPDRRSLLALHAAVAEQGPFDYLEIGSHLGGSLQSLVLDARCRSIVSIDTRPPYQPDDRGGVYHYEDNSTARMLDLLRAIPGADVAKLTTIERGTDELTPAELPVRPQFCFIDGEHTRGAALRDARFCLQALSGDGVIAFHDSNVVMPGIEDFVALLSDRPHDAFQLPDSVYVVELGSTRLRRSEYVRRAMAPLVS